MTEPRSCTGSITGKCRIGCISVCEFPLMGASHNAEIKEGTYVAGTTAALDMVYSKVPKEWRNEHRSFGGKRTVDGEMTVHFHNEKILRDMFSWEKAITSNTGFTKREMDILRHPQTHAADAIVTVALIRQGLLKVQKRFIVFGQKIITLTRAGRKAQRELPPECYRTKPTIQQRSENDCETCPHESRCLPYGNPTVPGTF